MILKSQTCKKWLYLYDLYLYPPNLATVDITEMHLHFLINTSLQCHQLAGYDISFSSFSFLWLWLIFFLFWGHNIDDPGADIYFAKVSLNRSNKLHYGLRNMSSDELIVTYSLLKATNIMRCTSINGYLGGNCVRVKPWKWYKLLRIVRGSGASCWVTKCNPLCLYTVTG